MLSDRELERVCRELAGPIARMLRNGFRFTTADGRIGEARISSEFEIEDLTQLTLAEFCAQVRNGNFDTDRPARPYVFTIARNQALRHLRKAFREVPVEDPADMLPPSPEPTFDAAKEICDQFAEELGPEEKRIFDICGRQELDQKTACEMLGLSHDQVHRRWKAIRQRLLRFADKRGWRGA